MEDGLRPSEHYSRSDAGAAFLSTFTKQIFGKINPHPDCPPHADVLFPPP